MPTIILKLDPGRLANPDLDLRYALPDLLARRTDNLIRDDGYDYASDGEAMLLFLKAADLDAALAAVIDVIENVRVLGNDLRPGVVVAVRRRGRDELVYPPGGREPFVR